MTDYPPDKPTPDTPTPDKPTPDTPTQPTDDELMGLLGEAVQQLASPPEGMVDMIMTGYDITNVDMRIAELVEDSAAGGIMAVRAATVDVRLLTFESDGVTFEFEIGPEPPHVVGEIDPPGTGTMRMEQGANVQELTLDEHGRFEFTLASSGSFRLVFVPAAGTPIASEWLLS